MLAKQQILDLIKPEFRKMIRDKINDAENFFKHADRDHGDSLAFDPRQTEILLIDASSQYFKLTGEDLPLCAIFRGWFIANHPELFTFPEEQMGPLKMAAPAIADMGRFGYFNTMLPFVLRAHG